MPIECTVELGRSTAYFTGEHLTAKGREVDKVMWISAQIHCHLATSQRYVKLPQPGERDSLNNLTVTPEGPSGVDRQISGSGRPITPAGKVLLSATSLQDPVAATRAGTTQTPNTQLESVYASTAQVLACDISLDPNGSVTYLFREQIPADCPPTYRGAGIKYGYKITIGMQRFGEATATLNVPFRVFSLQDPEGNLSSYSREDSGVPSRYSDHKIDPASLFEALKLDDFQSSEIALPKENEFFLEAIKAAQRRLDLAQEERERRESEHQETSSSAVSGPSSTIATYDETDAHTYKRKLQTLATLTLRSAGKKQTFNVGDGDVRVCTFTLYRPVCRVGEEVIGLFDFSHSTLPCHHVSVNLESVEDIKPEFRSNGPWGAPKPVIHAEHHEYCRFTTRTYINLFVPLTGFADMETDMVQHRWQLSFTFTTDRPQTAEKLNVAELVQYETEDIIANAPAYVPVQTMSWKLPIRIYPTSPANVPGKHTVMKGFF